MVSNSALQSVRDRPVARLRSHLSRWRPDLPTLPRPGCRRRHTARLGTVCGNLAACARYTRKCSERIASPVTLCGANTAMRLGRYFGTSAAMWLALQMTYDLDVARSTIGPVIEREVLPWKPAAEKGSI